MLINTKNVGLRPGGKITAKVGRELSIGNSSQWDATIMDGFSVRICFDVFGEPTIGRLIARIRLDAFKEVLC